jgi:predicted nucleotidyltransferase
MGLDEQTIRNIVHRVLGVAHPERILLFGSAARDDMNDDSDIDLLVLERDPVDTRKESVVVRRALRGLHWPFDVVVMSMSRYMETRDTVGGLAFPASREGKVIYEAA